MATITPEQQITNVLRTLQRTTAAKPYTGQLSELRDIARQLADMWAKFCAGELPAVTDETPF